MTGYKRPLERVKCSWCEINNTKDYTFTLLAKICKYCLSFSSEMSAPPFNPIDAHCFNWKKIYPDYRRHLDFEKPDPTCAECSKPGKKFDK